MTTFTPKPTDIKRAWHHYDAGDYVLGRLASDIAQKLIGKHKPYFTAHLDCGDYVVVTNASAVKTTGTKLTDKIYYHHSGYPSGLKSETLGDKLTRDPVRVIELAVAGMLPKNKLRSPRLKRLKVFADTTHPYQEKFIQKPE